VFTAHHFSSHHYNFFNDRFDLTRSRKQNLWCYCFYFNMIPTHNNDVDHSGSSWISFLYGAVSFSHSVRRTKELKNYNYKRAKIKSKGEDERDFVRTCVAFTHFKRAAGSLI
jgi:hypothetical protein